MTRIPDFLFTIVVALLILAVMARLMMGLAADRARRELEKKYPGHKVRIVGGRVIISKPAPPPDPPPLTLDQHRERHMVLHRALDELGADWMNQQPLGSDKRFSNTTVMELMQWSHEQTQNPTDPRR